MYRYVEGGGGGGDGTDRVERLVDGRLAPLDEGDELLAAFRRLVPPGDVLVETERELVEYCKATATRLWFDGGGADAAPAETLLPGSALVGNLLEASTKGTRDDPTNLHGVHGQPSRIWVPQAAFREMAAKLGEGSDGGDLRCVTNLPIKRSFVYIDVSGFSKFTAGEQALIVPSLARLASDPGMWNRDPAGWRAAKDLEAMICIGDGYIYVFKETALATIFAAHLAGLIEMLIALKQLPVEFHFRMGVHCGPVYSFWDPGRNGWNYIGDGINGGQRVLRAIGSDTDDVLFISADVRQELLADRITIHETGGIIASAQNRGRRLDKHGRSWRVYEVNHTSVFAGSAIAEELGRPSDDEPGP